MSRLSSVARVERFFDDGGFFTELARRVAIRTESQEPASRPALQRDLVDEMTPSLNTLGFECRVFDNPDPRGGPLLVARRFEGEGSTRLSYGHGDVVREDRKFKRPFPDRGRPGTGLDALGAATGCSQYQSPPQPKCSKLKSKLPLVAASTCNTCWPAGITSLPMPSPGMVAIA